MTGSQGELRSVFAKIEPRNIGSGTSTNAASRNLTKSLGDMLDDAGHGIGKDLGGPGGARSGNLFPQNPSINRGIFKAHEQAIVDEVMAGNEVFVRVVPRYLEGATRPYEVLYQTRINGQTISRVFDNPLSR